MSSFTVYLIALQKVFAEAEADRWYFAYQSVLKGLLELYSMLSVYHVITMVYL